MILNWLLCLLILASSGQEVIDRIYATVNDEVITNSDISAYQKQLKSRLLYEDLLFADEAAIEASIKDRKILVEKLINEKILDSEAKKLGINISDDRVQKEVDGKGGEKHLSSLLSQKNLTIKDYKSFLKKSLARREVINYYVGSKIKISDDDILDYYTSQNKGASSGQSFEYNLSHILFTPDSSTSKEQALSSAQEALRLIAEGQSFSSVHSKYNSKNKDDQFGVFKSGEMLPVIENSIVKLKSGETSQIVQSPLGFHIFRVNQKKIVNNPDFERKRQQIFQILFTKGYKEQLDYWLHQKRRAAVVKINA
jgi:peptidyl-prolyl cis-trans isomerase SurA